MQIWCLRCASEGGQTDAEPEASPPISFIPPQKLKLSSQQPHHIPAEEKNTLDKLTDFSSHPLLMFQCICICKHFYLMHKRATKRCLNSRPNKTQKQYKKKTNRKQTKRKRALAYKKTHKNKTKYNIYLYIFLLLTLYLLILLINAEPTSQSVQIFPFRTHTNLSTNLKSSLPLQNQFNTSTTLTIRHLRPQQILYILLYTSKTILRPNL